MFNVAFVGPSRNTVNLPGSPCQVAKGSVARMVTTGIVLVVDCAKERSVKLNNRMAPKQTSGPSENTRFNFIRLKPFLPCPLVFVPAFYCVNCNSKQCTNPGARQAVAFFISIPGELC